MMANAREASVGLFVLGGGALALLIVALFGKLDVFGQSRAAELVFEGSISGLGVGAPVTFRGVRVGAVSSIAIEYDPQTHVTYIPVKLRLKEPKVAFPRGISSARPPISEWVAEGLRAQLVPVSLIAGESEIDLDFDRSAPARLHPNIAELPEIPVSRTPTGQVAQRLSQLPLQELGVDATQMMQSFRALADSLSRSLPQLVDSTARSSAKAGDALDAATQAIRELQGRMQVTLAGIDRLTAAGERQLDGRGTDLHALLVSSNQAVSETHELLSNVKGLTDHQGAARANLEATLSDLSAASAALRGFANDLEQNPRLLLSGRKQ